MQRHLLQLIVGSKLSSVDNRVTHDVRAPSYPESLNTILLESLFVAVNTGGIWTLLRGQLALTLHAHLYKICWVCYCDSNCTCCHASNDLLYERWILTWLHFSADNVPDRHVKTDTKTSKDKLTLQTWRETRPEGSQTFFSSDCFHRSKHTIVTWCDTRLNFLNLQTHFCCVKRNRGSLTDHTGGGGHQDVSYEESGIALSWHSLRIHGAVVVFDLTILVYKKGATDRSISGK